MARSICVDGMFLGRNYLGSGVNRYSVNLLRELETITAGTCFRTRILVGSSGDAEHDLRAREGFEFVLCKPMRPRRVCKRIMLMETARRLKADMVFLPLPERVYIKRTRLAVTIHDVIPLLFPQEIPGPEGRRVARNFMSGLRKADLILTDSQYSKGDIVDKFGIAPSRVVVSYLGYESSLFRPLRVAPVDALQRLERLELKPPYLLHVGFLQPRKNVGRLIRAYRLLRDRRRDFSFRLVLCGRRRPGDGLNELVRQLSLEESVVLTGPVSDEDLAALYQSASGFAMPSLYEGFGLPPLEAMACGIPVMSSDRSSLPEVLGDAALYFDPESIEDMAGAMEKLCGDSALRSQLVKLGLERVKQFSWEKCARATLAAFESV